jgi:hypothetical protein
LRCTSDMLSSIDYTQLQPSAICLTARVKKSSEAGRRNPYCHSPAGFGAPFWRQKQDTPPARGCGNRGAMSGIEQVFGLARGDSRPDGRRRSPRKVEQRSAAKLDEDLVVAARARRVLRSWGWIRNSKALALSPYVISMRRVGKMRAGSTSWATRSGGSVRLKPEKPTSA